MLELTLRTSQWTCCLSFSLSFISKQFTARSTKSEECNAVLKVYSGRLQVEKCPRTRSYRVGNVHSHLTLSFPLSLSFISKQFTARSTKSGECNAVLKVYTERLQVENALASSHTACGTGDESESSSSVLIMGDINIIVGVHGLIGPLQHHVLCELWLSHVRSHSVLRCGAICSEGRISDSAAVCLIVMMLQRSAYGSWS